MRILGLNLPDNQRVEYGLTLIYGIGWTKSAEIMKQAGIDRQKRRKVEHY